MLCCRPRLTGDEQNRPISKGETTQKRPPRVSTDGWTVISSHEHATHLEPDRQYKTLDRNFKMGRPRVDHVKSVKDDLQGKLAGTSPRQHVGQDKGHVIYYSGEGRYKTAPGKNSAANVNIGRSISHNYKGMSIPRAKLQVTRSYSTREQQEHKAYRVSARIPNKDNVARYSLDSQTNGVARFSQESKTNTTQSKNYGIKIPKTSVDSGADVKSDSDSLTDEQQNALDQLDYTLSEYNTGVFDEVNPVIVTDILPYGVFEADDKFDSGLESDEMPSSRTSSLSSSKSLSGKGIMSSVVSKRRVPSVSFNLPPEHVDKPYAPLQFNKQRTAAPAPPPPPTISITDYKNNVWHTGSDTVFVEERHARRSSGPFKGSFKKIFYGKYAPQDMSGHEQGKLHVSPMLLERVSSYESLNDDKLMQKQSTRRK